MGFQITYNKGIAFSLPVTGILSILIASLIVIGLLYFYYRYCNKKMLSSVVFGMIVGGAVGNIIDRIMIGEVVDFIKIFSYPSFNVADASITIGFLLLILTFDRIKA